MPATGIWNSSGCVHSVPKVSPNSGGIGLGLCIVAWAVGFFIIACNWLTISGVVRDPRLRTLSNYFIASLAAADSMVGVLLLPLGLSFLPKYQYLVIDSYVGCTSFLACLFMSIYCSGVHMLLVSVERYIFLTKPPIVYMKFINGRTVFGSVTLSWVLAVVFGSCVFLLNNYGVVRSCYGHEIINPVFSVYLSSIQHLVLAIILACIYGSIMRLAAKRQKEARKSSGREPGSSNPICEQYFKMEAVSHYSKEIQLCNKQTDPSPLDHKPPEPAAATADGESSSCCDATPIATQDRAPGCPSVFPGAAHNLSTNAALLPDTSATDEIQTVPSLDPASSSQVLTPASSSDADSFGDVPTSPASARNQADRKPLDSVRLRLSQIVATVTPTSTALETMNVANNESNNAIDSGTVPSAQHCQSESFTTAHWKASRLYVYICGFFVVFWLPYYLCIFINLNMCVPGAAIDLSVLLGLFNSGANFFVYALTSKDFRAYYKRTLCQCHC